MLWNQYVLVSVSQAQFTLNYPKTPNNVVPPVNQQLLNRFPSSILAITDSSNPRASVVMNCNGQNEWALTYDDGPSQPTPTLLQELKRRGIKATFFVVGAQIQENPNMLKSIHADGHEIGIHTWSHPHLTRLSNEQIITEVMYTYQIIKDLVGVSARLFRPPFGELNKRVQTLIQTMGFEIINWSDDTNDAVTKGASVQSAVNSWISQRRTRIISLQHDLFAETVAQVPAMLDTIQKSGQYQFKTIGQCTGLNPDGELLTESPVTRVIITSTSVPIPTTASSTQGSTTDTSATFNTAPNSTLDSTKPPTGSGIKSSVILGHFVMILMLLL